MNCLDDGIEGDTCDILMREILSTYGVGTIVLLQNLEQAGLLVRAKDPAIFSALGKHFSPPKVATWSVCKTALRLVVDYQPKGNWWIVSMEYRLTMLESVADVEEAEAFSGYIPLSARIVQGALDDSSWKKLLSTLSNVFKNVYSAFEEDIPRESHRLQRETKSKSLLDAVVVIVGGVTRAEAAAMKALANSIGKRLLIVSTAVVNGIHWMESMVDASEDWPLTTANH